MRLNKYETLLIVPSDIESSQFDALKKVLVDAVVQQGGMEIALQDWGVHKLAYPIKKKKQGKYVYFRYLASSNVIPVLENVIQLRDEVMRFITVKLAEKIDSNTFDVEADRAGIYPFGVKPSSPSKAQYATGAEETKGQEQRDTATSGDEPQNVETPVSTQVGTQLQQGKENNRPDSTQQN